MNENNPSALKGIFNESTINLAGLICQIWGYCDETLKHPANEAEASMATCLLKMIEKRNETHE